VRPELMASHPRVAAWHARIMARPAVKATYEPSEEAPARRPVAAA
jgi:glutathione S-transferase